MSWGGEMRNKRTAQDRLITLGIIAVPLVWLGAVSVIVYVAYHFITKFW